MQQHAVTPGRVLLDGEGIRRTLSRVAHEIIEGNERLDQVALIGIHTRGVFLAQRLRRLIEEFTGADLALGTVDITFYRDDVQVRGRDAPLHPQPLVRATRIDFPLEGRTCVLVDDVLYTGRTIRAAIDALFDYGRPARVQLAVICDRGHRELPIRPDYVGKIMASKAWSGDSSIIITWDESDFTGSPTDFGFGDTRGCCDADPGGGHVLTIVINRNSNGPSASYQLYNHYSLLSTIENAWNLGCLAFTCHTANVEPMSELAGNG